MTRFTISLIRTRHRIQDEVGAAGRIPDVGRANFCDVVLMHVPKLEGDVPIIRELVISRKAVPLKIIIAPSPVIDAVGANIDIVPRVV